MANQKRTITIAREKWTRENRSALHILFFLFRWLQGDDESVRRIFHRMYPGFQRCGYTHIHLWEQWNLRWGEGHGGADWQAVDRPNPSNNDSYTDEELSRFATLRQIIEEWAEHLLIALRPIESQAFSDQRHRQLVNNQANPNATVEAMRPGQRPSAAMIKRLGELTGKKPGMPVDGLELPNTRPQSGAAVPPSDAAGTVDRDHNDTETNEESKSHGEKGSPPRRITRSKNQQPTLSAPSRDEDATPPADADKENNENQGQQGKAENSEDDEDDQTLNSLTKLAVKEPEFSHKLEMLHHKDVKFSDEGILLSEKSLRNAAFVNHDTAVYQYGGWVYQLYLSNNVHPNIMPEGIQILDQVMICNKSICATCSDGEQLKSEGSFARAIVQKFPSDLLLPIVHRKDVEDQNGELIFSPVKPLIQSRSGPPPSGGARTVLFEVADGKGPSVRSVRVRLCAKGRCQGCDDHDEEDLYDP